MLPEPKQAQGFITVLLAEDNKVSRDMMAGVLEAQNFKTLHASDGGEAIELIKERDVDIALVDINMAPTGGFEFVKFMLVQGIDVPVVIITGDESTDTLVKANSLGVQRVLQKPIRPDRLIDTVVKILKRRGVNPDFMGSSAHSANFTTEELMKRAIDVARKNAESGRGRAYGAVVADKEGKILGEGTNGSASRADPIAHAEVMAIRQAAQKLSTTDLRDCILYVSSEPTAIGKALIRSVSIQKVYFGLSHDDIKTFEESAGPNELPPDADYEQLLKEEAEEMYKKITDDG